MYTIIIMVNIRSLSVIENDSVGTLISTTGSVPSKPYMTCSKFSTISSSTIVTSKHLIMGLEPPIMSICVNTIVALGGEKSLGPTKKKYHKT